MKLFKILLYCIIFFAKYGFGETLTFPTGQQIRFAKTTQWITSNWNSTVEMVFDCTYLGQKNVEIIIRNLDILNLEYQKGETEEDEEFSQDPQPNVTKIAATLAELIDQPLHFKIYTAFEVDEITGLLTQVLKKTNNEIFWGHQAKLGITHKSFAFFFTHLFHLKGCDLQVGKTPPIKVIALTPSKLYSVKGVEQLVFPLDHIRYQLTKVGNRKVEGNYHYKFKIDNPISDSEIYEIDEKGTWNLDNALQQTRDFTFTLMTQNGSLSIKVNWHSMPTHP